MTNEDIIFQYTREDALNDGFLVDVSDAAKQAGFKWPVAVTRAVWDDYIKWDDSDPSKPSQDIEGRLWDVLFMALCAIRQASEKDKSNNNSVLMYELSCIPRGEKKALLIKLKMMAHGGDNGETVMTILLPDED